MDVERKPLTPHRAILCMARKERRVRGMKNKKIAEKMLKKTEAKLRKTLLQPNNLIYTAIYHNICSLVTVGEYELSIDMCKALNRCLDEKAKA